MNRSTQNKGPTRFEVKPITSAPAMVALHRHEAGVR